MGFVKIFNQARNMLVLGVSLMCLLGSSLGRPDDYSYLTYEESNEIDSSEYGLTEGKLSTNCSCGWSNKPVGRIVGGRETFVNEYPYMAGLGYLDPVLPTQLMGTFCGATIVSKKHCITAAHCTYDDKDSIVKMGIVVGEHDQSKGYETSYTKVYPLKETVEHPYWNSKTYQNDIAVLVTKDEIEFNRAVGPACLPTRANLPNLEGEHVKVTGWGDMKKNGDSSDVLLKTNLKVLKLDICREKYPRKPINVASPTQLCTYSYHKDSCQGDSGGPLTWLDPDTNRYTLVAVVSYGTGCATMIPGVNTYIPPFLDWLQSTVKSTSSSSVRTCAKKRF